MAKEREPTCAPTRKTRSATLGFQKPTRPYERWARELQKRLAFLDTSSCMELFDGEHDRGELACCECLNRRYYLPLAQKNFTKEELEGLLVGFEAGRGYSKEKVLPFMVDKAGTRSAGCQRLHRSAEQFRILESLRKRIEKVEWEKVMRGEGN